MALESSSPETIPFSFILGKKGWSSSMSAGSAIVEEHETPLDPLDEPLPPWKLPKVRGSDVFKPDNCLLQALCLQTVTYTKFAQGTSEITLDSEETVTMQLMAPWKQHYYQNKGFDTVHLGMIQVGIAPRTRRGLTTSPLACLLDSRLLNFEAALLTAMQAPLEEGPISFSYYPDYSVSLDDRSVQDALEIRIRASDGQDEAGRIKLSIARRVCYQIYKGFNHPVVKRVSTMFDGVYLQSSLDGKKTTPKRLDPAQLGSYLPHRISVGSSSLERFQARRKVNKRNATKKAVFLVGILGILPVVLSAPYCIWALVL